jgi:Na+/proline symporter
MLVLVLYLILLFLTGFFNNRAWKSEVLKTESKKGWFLTGLSLFMYLISVDHIQLSFEVIKNQGLWGMWIYWSSMIGIFVVPYVFAPLWRKLDFVSDNDFILYRFSGKGAKILYLFRAYYLGILIITLLLSFHVLAFSKLLTAYFSYEKPLSLAITAALLLSFSIKNSFSVKLRTDVLHAILYLFALILFIVFVYAESGGLFYSISTLKSEAPYRLQVWPQNNEQYFYALVLIAVHWWSVQLFDGAGPEMIRFNTAKNEQAALRTGLFSIFLSFLSGTIIVLGIVMILSVQTKYPEIDDFHSLVKYLLPSWTAPIILLGWFSIFISTCESLLLWSAGLWGPDFYSRVSGSKEKVPPYFLFLTMFIVSLLSVISAYSANYLQDLIKWLFALSAGVAPIFVLRWFFYSINAWTQLAAMAIIPLLNAVYSQIAFEKILPFAQNETGSYIWRMLILTLACLLISISVMRFTAADEEETIHNFKKNLPSRKLIFRRFATALILGLSYFFLWNLMWYVLFS